MAKISGMKHHIFVSTKSATRKIAHMDIAYVCKVGKRTKIVTHGKVIEITCSNLSELKEALSVRDDFFESHSSLIVNLEWIKEVGGGVVIMLNGDALPLGSKNLAKTRKRFEEYCLKNSVKPYGGVPGAGAKEPM